VAGKVSGVLVNREELDTRARGFLERDPETLGRERYAEMALAYSQAVPDRFLRRSLESAGLHAVVDDGVRRLIDFSDLPEELQDKKARMEQLRELRATVLGSKIDWGGSDPAEFWRVLGGSPHFSLMEKARIVEQLPSLGPAPLGEMYERLKLAEQRMRELYRGQEADITRLYEALAGGEMADVYDYENAIAVAKRRSLRWLPFIAISSRTNPWLNTEKLSEAEMNQAESALRAMTGERAFEMGAWNGLGNLLSERRGRPQDAEQAYRRAIELDPRYALPWHNLGIQLGDLRRYEEAEQAYRRAMELDPRDADPWNNLGNLLGELKRYGEAEQAYRRAIELDPANELPWNNLGILLGDLKRYGEAEQAYRRAIELDPRDADPWNNLGILLRELERYGEAEQAYRRAIELDPRYAAPWNNLGVELERLERPGEAESAYRKAIELNPRSAFPWSNLGQTLEPFPSRHQEAAEAALRAFEIDATRSWDLERTLRIGDRLAESPSDLPALVKLAQHAGELAPDNREAQFLLARVRTLAGEWPEARSTAGATGGQRIGVLLRRLLSRGGKDWSH
jgi:Flp pilus assembly protein TadD